MNSNSLLSTLLISRVAKDPAEESLLNEKNNFRRIRDQELIDKLLSLTTLNIHNL